MVDLAIKMLLDDKARFLATVLGVGFSVALVLVQVGLFFGLLENASITIEKLDADLWVMARNTPNVDFGNPFPETQVQRVRSVPGVELADNLIVWYAVVSLPTGAKESVIYYGLDDFRRWGFPWNVSEGDTADLRRGRFVILDESAERRFGRFAAGDEREFQGRRLKIIGRTRDARSFTTNPMAFLDYRLAQQLSPEELGGQTTFILVKVAKGASVEEVRREIRARLPHNDVHTKAEWAEISRKYWIESTGLGMTIFLTVFLGALVGVVIVAQTLYASTAEHLPEFGTIKALGGRDLDVCGLIGEQAMFAAALGFGVGLALSLGLGPFLETLDMKMAITPAMGATVFVGTQILCLSAALLSFRKVAAIDPAIVFRG
ncbi:FtsX-like permease family protein [Aquisphaera giovannonii]|uniref:FtsX-like permease family protein n=1 Tax=Aquisphaera giovannonii TaxID=406548 RepID=A0A5B9W690_9BACT|nr:ABC transporter permease [Aquisphaera giovannonii]QEH36172.1 FtsX-like permease family protein [Aquisphaera giovannonii]